MKSIAHTTSKITKLILVTALIFSVLFSNALPAKAATLDDVANALRELQNSLNQYKMAKSGAVLAATITTVSTPAQLTAALNAATGGETILLAAGNYGEFKLSAKNYSSLVTVTAATPSNPPTFASFSIGSVNNFKLDKIYVAFFPTASSTNSTSGMAVTNVENFILSNSVFKSAPNPLGEQVGRGIGVTNGKNVTIAGNEVTGSRRGIMTGNIDVLTIKNNYVHDIRTSQLSGGVVSNVLIEGNFLTTSRPINFGGDGDHGDFIHYWTQPHQTGPSDNFKIINNFMEQGGGTALLGIYMDNNINPQGFTNVHIENNILHNSNGQGMRLEKVVGAVIKNNTLIQNLGDFRKSPRIRLESGTKNVVLEKNIVSNTTVGVAMEDPTGNNLIERDTLVVQIEDATKANYAGKLLVKAPVIDGEIEDHAVKAGSIAVGYGATLLRSQIMKSEVVTVPVSGGGVITPTPVAAPTLTLAASAASVTSGGASTLTWSSTNATACTASGAWTGAKTVNGTQSTGVLSTVGTQTYTLACTGTGGSVTKSVSVAVTSGSVISPTPTAPTLTLTSSASSIIAGDNATLTWSSTNATACTASGAWTGAKTVNGTQSTGALSTVGTQTYTLACTGTGGSVTKSVNVAVTAVVVTPTPLPTNGFAIGKRVVTTGTVNVRTAAGITSPLISAIPIGVEGTIMAGPIAIEGYTWWQTNFDGAYADGWTSDRELILVVSTTPTPAPTLTLTASPSSLTSGASATLNWSSTNATACTASGSWTGAKTVNGTQSTGALSIAGTQTYTLTCTGAGGSIARTATVGVIAPTPNVTTTANLNVRSTAGGTLLGTQPLGATGVSDSTTQVTVNGTTWIYVNFTVGFDGYVSTTYLTGSGVTTNNQALITSLLAQLAVLQAALAALLAQ